MKLATIALLGLLGIPSLCPIALAQSATRQVTLGILEGSATAPDTRLIRALRDLGYQQDRNLTIEFRSANGHNDELPRLAAELVRLKPDVIVGAGTPVLLALKEATPSIQIVMMGSGDPVKYGLVQSLAHPGANITGRSDQTSDLGPKRFQLLKETLPGICCVARLGNPSNPGNASEQTLRDIITKSLDIEIKYIWVATPDQLEQVLAAPLDDRFKALFLTGDAMFVAHRAQIAEAALRRGFATFGPYPNDAQAGFLEAYGENPGKVGTVAAAYVDKILKGAKPADLPIAQPTEFQLVVNLKTAKALGLTIPQSILARADEVIE